MECGCGLAAGSVKITTEAGEHEHSPDHGHEHEHEHHHHSHAHEHAHAHEPSGFPETISVHRSLLEKNERLAERNRGFFKARRLLTLNMVSSPGSGKTSLIGETALGLKGKLRVAVIAGDLATDNDAARLRQAGIAVVQVTTGTVCHLDAEMVSKAAAAIDLEKVDLLIIENVGNLVCPADFDLGEDLRVVLLSTTEGEDKPLKYPPIFHSAHAAIITKTDLAPAVGFQREQALANLRRISHHAHVFELSSKTGEGMAAWLAYLQQQRAERAS